MMIDTTRTCGVDDTDGRSVSDPMMQGRREVNMLFTLMRRHFSGFENARIKLVAPTPGVREARLWYWKRKQPAPPKPPGYWKWEATLAQDGTCHVPQASQIEQYLTEMLAELEAG